MNKLMVYGLSLAVLFGTVQGIAAFAYTGLDDAQRATPETLAMCRELGIPEFTCNENTVLAKMRVTEATGTGAYGSGTAMLGTGDLETLAILGGVGAIFGGVAAAFFAKSRMGKKAEAEQ